MRSDSMYNDKSEMVELVNEMVFNAMQCSGPLMVLFVIASQLIDCNTESVLQHQPGSPWCCSVTL